MYQLTIDTGAEPRTTRHGDQAEAHQALLDHAIETDVYLFGDRRGDRAATTSPNPLQASTFHLLRLTPNEREPRCVGIATITTSTGTDAATDPHLRTAGAVSS